MTRPWLFKPMFWDMGQAARRHPEELVFGLLASGFTTNCYDGRLFFDTDHPVTDATGATVQVSNLQGGAGTAWYLLDTSRAIRPIIWQEREKYEFQQLTRGKGRSTSFPPTAPSTASGRGSMRASACGNWPMGRSRP